MLFESKKKMTDEQILASLAAIIEKDAEAVIEVVKDMLVLNKMNPSASTPKMDRLSDALYYKVRDIERSTELLRSRAAKGQY